MALEEATGMTIADIKALEGDEESEEDQEDGDTAKAQKKPVSGKKKAPVLTPARR